MKKKYFIPALVLVGCLFFAACGSSDKSEAVYNVKESYDTATAADFYSDSEGMAFSPSPSLSRNMKADSGRTEMSNQTSESGSAGVIQRKVIKTASLEVQTKAFDDFINTLNAKIEEVGGYIEHSDISGNSIYSNSSRNANFTIRVPEDKIQAIVDGVGEHGTITNSNYNEEDITLSYVDVESRIKTLTTEQETLLGLLEKAAHLEDIIRLEERLSEVNYQLETYKSRQRTYDNKISYSTVYVNVREVYRIANVVEKEPQTLGQRIAEGFKDNMLNIKTGLENFVVWFLSYIVNIIFWGVVLAVGIFFAIRSTKKASEKKANKKIDTSEEKNETKMGDNK